MPDYAFYLYLYDWPEMITALNELEIRLRTNRRPEAADMLLRAYGELRDRLTVIGREMSVAATAELRRQEHDTRVRPDTQGEGGPRLGDSLEANPLVGLPPASIGVANETRLNSDVPWWITNEIGSSARVGESIFGIFYGRGAGGGLEGQPPDMGYFREHPLFAPASSKDGGGKGVIQNPIPARRFIARSVPEIERLWKNRVRDAKATFDTELTRVLATHR